MTMRITISSKCFDSMNRICTCKCGCRKKYSCGVNFRCKKCHCECEKK